MIAVLAALLFQCPDGSPPPCSRAGSHAAAVNPSSVAVLYFENHSRDTTEAQLADGLTEELITRLSQVNRLDVKSRYESRRVRGAGEDPRSIGRELHTAYLVSGSLQQAGAKVRINVALLRSSTGAQVWGDIYDRSGEDLLAIQSDIASTVATAITGQLLPTERASLTRRPTRDGLAYDLYLRARAAFGLSESGTRDAIALFDQAIARDSTFADAWAQKAWAWVWLADGYMVARDAYTNARASANRALALDSSQAAAWTVLSAAAEALDLDHAATRAFALRAEAANPRDAMAHLGPAATFEFDADMDVAVHEAALGFMADTLSALGAFMYLDLLREGGRFDSIGGVLPHARAALGPDDIRPWEGLVAWGRGDAATAARLLSWRYYGGRFAGYAASALIAAGHRDAALAARDSAVEYARAAYYNPYGLAGMYAALGDHENALRYLEQAYDERTIWLCDIRIEPYFRSLRSEPRFAALMRRLGYTP